MRPAVLTGLVFAVLGLVVHAQGGQAGDGRPAKFLGSCEADVTGDGRAELVQLVETIRGVELIAMVPTDAGGYSAFLLRRDKPGSAGILQCQYAPEVTETRAGPGDRQPRVRKTPGAFVHLLFRETSSVACVWTQNRFSEIWTSG